MADTNEKKYILGDGEKEAQRLNFQHALLLKLSDGNLLHPSIDKTRIMKVADVGTGTGIWLEDVSQLLGNLPGNSELRQYDGFDITTALFPKDHKEIIRYIQHDTLQPFPEEYHNTYDLVHVRFMALAFKGADWKVAVTNLVELLKPGGYLQWDEFEQGLWSHPPSYKMVNDTLAIGMAFTAKVGFSVEASLDVMAAFEADGLKDIVKTDYSSTRHPELADDYQVWGLACSRAGWLPIAILHSGKVGSKEEADEMAEKMLKGWEEDYAQGCVPLVPWKMMVGWKP